MDLGQDRVGVQRVVQIEIRGNPRTTDPEQLPEAEIELVHALAVHRSGANDVDGDECAIGRERPPERLGGFGRRDVVVGENLRPGTL